MGAPETDEQPSPATAGFYGTAAPDDIAQALAAAALVRGLDQEIALLRMALNDALHKHGDDLDWDKVIARANAVVNAVVKRYRIDPRGAAELTAAMYAARAHFDAEFGALRPMEDDV